MKIKSIKVIEGKNKWSETKDKLIHMVLDLGEYEQKPSNKIDGFYERIKEYLPSLKSHRCSEGKPGGFLKRIKEGTWMGHIIEHVALELQTLAGYDTGWGRTRSVRDQKGVYNVVFNYEDEECGKMAAREAYNVVKDIINDKDPQIDNIVKKLKPKKQIRESIRRILKEETQSETPVEVILNTLYPNFNKENASIKHVKSKFNKDVITYDDPETGYPFCSYWIDFKELTLEYELYETLEKYLNQDTFDGDLLNWFNSEFNKDAEFISF